jgi:hypothetical protein
MATPAFDLRSQTMQRFLLSLAIGLAAFDASAGSRDVVTRGLPEHHAADPQAQPITDTNLLQSDRFWPYEVALAPDAKLEIPDGSVGVLIRVESGGIARIDFGRDGLRNVPIDRTDVVARANDVRNGKLDKTAANFVLALGPRLLDPSGAVLRPFPFEVTALRPGFLCVFADPSAKEFADIATALAPLRDRADVLTMVFPQGQVPDAKMRERLRELGWEVPFVYDHLSEAYTETLLSGGVRPPAVVLQTNEGRVLLERAWRADVAPELGAALDRAFGGAPAASAAAGDK